MNEYQDQAVWWRLEYRDCATWMFVKDYDRKDDGQIDEGILIGRHGAENVRLRRMAGLG